MSEQISFEVVTVTKQFIKARGAEGHPHLDDFTLGQYEVIVTWPDSYTEYYGPYSTKKDAQDMIRGAKKSNWGKFLNKAKDD
tara:strand:+ start:3027 stop:3272 length:246 start_codon:yes stop_codon:yes gene_type:complete